MFDEEIWLSCLIPASYWRAVFNSCLNLTSSRLIAQREFFWTWQFPVKCGPVFPKAPDGHHENFTNISALLAGNRGSPDGLSSVSMNNPCSSTPSSSFPTQNNPDPLLQTNEKCINLCVTPIQTLFTLNSPAFFVSSTQWIFSFLSSMPASSSAEDRHASPRVRAAFLALSNFTPTFPSSWMHPAFTSVKFHYILLPLTQLPPLFPCYHNSAFLPILSLSKPIS